jgi:translation initiation factor 2B subunit (eIF-2B alpha/beta/delta family)
VSSWEEWSTLRRIAALIESPQGGEAENGSAVAAELAVFIERLHAYEPDELTAGIDRVVRNIMDRRPTSAPLLTLVNAVLLTTGKGPATMIAEVRSVAERLRTSVGILATMGAAFIPDGGSVLAHGSSSSVRQLLEEAAATKRFRVTCGSGEDDAGRLFAADLIAAGISVEVIDEDYVVDSLLGVDLVVTGAFAFGPESMINIAGTTALVKEADNSDVRVLLVASADKALPAPLFDRAAATAMRSYGQEVVGLSYFEAIVTELGVMDPATAGRLAEQRQVAPQLA